MQLIDQHFTCVIKRWRLGWLTSGALLLLAATSSSAAANVTIVQEEFTGSTTYGWTSSGTFTPCLTAIGSSPPESIPNCAPLCC